jgi:hypothetical protein
MVIARFLRRAHLSPIKQHRNNFHFPWKQVELAQPLVRPFGPLAFLGRVVNWLIIQLTERPRENSIDTKTVRKLEEELENPIADVIRRLGRKEVPPKLSRHTIEMMAKAAVAAYEAAVAEHERRRDE